MLYSRERSESQRRTLQMRIWEKILCSWACAAYCQNCEPNSHASRVRARFSVLTLCSPTHGFSNKCLFCNARRWLSTLSPIYKLKTVDISYSSVLHLLTRLQWTRRFGRLPYEDLAPKTFMKTSFQRIFDPKSSQGNRNRYYPKLRKTLDFPASIA